MTEFAKAAEAPDLAPPGSALYYALRFAPRQHQPALRAVHGFAEEILAVPWTVSDPGVGQVKLDWWQAEIERIASGKGRHPLATALGPAITRHGLPLTPFRQLIDGARMDLEYGSYPDGNALASYLHRTGIPLAALELQIGHPYRDDNDSAAHHAGMGLRLTELLRRLRPALDRGRCYLPESDLRAAGLSVEQLPASAGSDAARQALVAQVDNAASLLHKASEALDLTDSPGYRCTRIRVRLAAAILQEMRRADYPMLQAELSLTPLRRLWLAWRTG
ncbi:squalene/phytoene synthase family protein [Methylonatrum kenyense]|uniref:squalene/phytoene synthase family protein n=1 Tax=Methylonatrum kenyense TaxID=455253 RepID=UPI0020C0A0AB|nr:squalene/phytoene synthase family protein [Methylonatrum kenyense]MCK8515959.1 squalene/phytoene synthase family protein [Methylonatrum kenyense]